MTRYEGSVGEEMQIRTKLQHLLHPVNLWCRIGGHAAWCFRMYEKWVWQPLLRRLLAT